MKNNWTFHEPRYVSGTLRGMMPVFRDKGGSLGKERTRGYAFSLLIFQPPLEDCVCIKIPLLCSLSKVVATAAGESRCWRTPTHGGEGLCLLICSWRVCWMTMGCTVMLYRWEIWLTRCQCWTAFDWEKRDYLLNRAAGRLCSIRQQGKGSFNKRLCQKGSWDARLQKRVISLEKWLHKQGYFRASRIRI